MLRGTLAMTMLVFLMGHDHGGCGGGDGPPTEASCDPRLRWDNFGSTFMTQYCTTCHSSKVQGGQRRGAPTDHDFDTQDGVQASIDHIDATAGSGPGATNVYMPPYGPTPTTFEREQLASWLACGAP
jgi:hypothetical protein